ncbi:alpha/beta hydrolase [Legionella cherrii]|uniref:Alpha/beta hydrolase family n=1 Tax=Legionella cherrii TaxID=28084 RepID=A0ABY6T2K5_9GAMM|nr:alpha/beta fold hydrolase [Legionella cherrii]VEB33843.1 Alpha/beta hydrolase family [Legionella cherrii]
MGSSYKSIYAELGASEKVQQLHQQALNDRNQLKLGYLNEAFDVYLDSKETKDQNPEQPQNIKAYKKLAENNPHFAHYYKAALLLYHEKLDAAVVEARGDDALREAFQLALTSLISKKIIKNDKEKMEAVITSLVDKAKEIGAKNYATTNDWHIGLADLIVAQGGSKKVREQRLKAENEINRTMQNALTALEPYARYGTERIDYNIAKVIECACKQYEDLNPNPNVKRQGDLKAIRGIIKKHQDTQSSPDDVVKEIANYFLSENFSRGFSSRFEDLIKKAIKEYAVRHHKTGNDIRTLQTKTWSDSTLDKEPRKLVLAVHGLQDSVNTFNVVANQYVRKGYKVISYDQSGAAFDESRGKEDLNIKQMQFDFYSMLEKAYRDPNVDEIVLLGHSLGGAVIANALNTIHELNENPPEGIAKNKIKKIQLVAPAVMKNPLLQIIGNIPTLYRNPSDKDEHAQLVGQRGIRREGGASALSSLGDFITFVANAFKNLSRFFKKEDVDKLIPIEVHYSENDGLVNKSNFEELAAIQRSPKTESKAKIFKNPEGQHHLHAAPSSTLVEGVEELPDIDDQQSSLKL